MKKRMTRLTIAFCFLLLFTIFSWTVKQGAFRNNDFAFTVKVQEAIDKSPRLRLSRMVGEVMEGSTFFASPEFSVVVIVGITVIAMIKKKKNRWTVLAIPVFFGLLILAEIYGKTVVHHPAPPFFMIKNPTSVFPKYYINEQFSYPSGHAARAIFLALVVLSLTMKQWSDGTIRRNILVAAVLGIYVGLVSLSRIYLGHHWVSDIVGGLLLGGGMSFSAIAFLHFGTDR